LQFLSLQSVPYPSVSSEGFSPGRACSVPMLHKQVLNADAICGKKTNHKKLLQEEK